MQEKWRTRGAVIRISIRENLNQIRRRLLLAQLAGERAVLERRPIVASTQAINEKSVGPRESLLNHQARTLPLLCRNVTRVCGY